jgi:hypothetical protein
MTQLKLTADILTAALEGFAVLILQQFSMSSRLGVRRRSQSVRNQCNSAVKGQQGENDILIDLTRSADGTSYLLASILSFWPD